MNWINLGAFKQLTLAQWGWLWAAYWRLWWVQIKIKWGESGRWLANVQLADHAQSMPLSNDKSGQHNFSIKQSDQLFELVRLAARMHLWQTACLPKSIVLADMLNAKLGERRASVVVGVQRTDSDKSDRSIASHAWVELDGRVVGEPASITEQFTQISS